MILSCGCSTAGGGVVLHLIMVTSAEAKDVRRLVILALGVNIIEFVSLACNTSASMSSSSTLDSNYHNHSKHVHSCIQ